MSQYFTNQDEKTVVLSSEPFANPGGEGAIYEVIQVGDLDLVAKIYHTKKIADERKEKIEFMHANNPTNGVEEAIKKAIVWIKDVLYREGQFVGFTMKKITNAISLKALTLSKNPSKMHGNSWKAFDHNELGAHQKRLIVAYNLAQAVHVIHSKGDYVLVDLKPENVFVREDGSIAIIDLDSLQIHNETVSFPAKVYTEEYAPAEKHRQIIDHRDGRIGVEWDHFSLAVIIYELLFGIHPYQASHQLYTTRPELIKEGFFVQGQKQKTLHKIPSIHENFEKLNEPVQQLFHQTFDRGHLSPKERVNSAKWAEVIFPQINNHSVYSTVMDFSALVPIQEKKPILPKIPEEKTWNDKVEGAKPRKNSIGLVVAILFGLFAIGTLIWVGSLGSGSNKPTNSQSTIVVVEGQKRFVSGSTEEEVRNVQGKPDMVHIGNLTGTRIYDKTFVYGESKVFFKKHPFKGGYVVANYENFGNLKVYDAVGF